MKWIWGNLKLYLNIKNKLKGYARMRKRIESTYGEFVFKEVQKTKRAIDKLDNKLLYITENT